MLPTVRAAAGRVNLPLLWIFLLRRYCILKSHCFSWAYSLVTTWDYVRQLYSDKGSKDYTGKRTLSGLLLGEPNGNKCERLNKTIICLKQYTLELVHEERQLLRFPIINCIFYIQIFEYLLEMSKDVCKLQIVGKRELSSQAFI